MFDPFRRRPLAKVRTTSRVPRRKPREDESAPSERLDPVALSLAIWLALVVAVTGFSRLASSPAESAGPNHAPRAGQTVQAPPGNYGGT